MGNSSSKVPSRTNTVSSTESISKPKALYSVSEFDQKDANGASHVHRRATSRVHTAAAHSLGVPAATSHRRSRSALAATPNRDSVPPPYSVAINSDNAGFLSPGSFSPPPAAHDARRRSWNLGSHAQTLPSSSSQDETFAIPADRVAELRKPMRQNSVENALDTLRKYNTVIIVDDSGSMEGARWHEARDALAALADIASKYDADGIDVCFLNNKHVGTNMKDANLVRRLFDHVKPQGITPIGEKLESLLLYYLGSLEHAKAQADAGDHKSLDAIKPVNYIVITDGAPTDDPETVIVAAARRLDAHNFPLSQVGIQFVQIGNSRDATAFLGELDDGLSQTYGIRDIVDTTPYTGGGLSAELIIKILLGGINRRVDRKGGKSVI